MADRAARDRADELAEGADYYHYFLLRYGIQHAELELEWCDWVLQGLRRDHP